MKSKAVMASGFFLVILSLIFVSLWANAKFRERKGITHLAEGPQGTLFLTVEDSLLKVSSEGRLLNRLHLKNDLGISERITDILVRQDGSFLIGLSDSREIRTYSQEGKIIRKYHVEHPTYDFLMTSDSTNGYLYVSSRGYWKGHVEIFGPDWQKIATISDFINPDKPQPAEGFANEEEGTQTPPMKDYHDYFEPADIVYYNGQLHIADYGNRIVILKNDGSLDRIIPSQVEGGPQAAAPVRIARFGDMLYVITWDDKHDGGEIIAVEIQTGKRLHIGNVHNDEAARLLFKDAYHYPDIVARKGDILVTDQNAMRVQRFATGGGFVGFLGDDSLLNAFKEIEKPYRIYKLVRWFSISGAILALIAFIFIYRNLKSSSVGRSVLLTLITIGSILGPEGSIRRKVLLMAVPGLGQLEAGRKFRSVIFFFPFLIVLFWFGSSLLASLRGVYYSFYYVIYSGVLLSLIMTASAKDVYTLNLKGATPWQFSAKGILTTLLSPLIPVAMGAVSQILWELYVKKDPEFSFVLQEIIKDILLFVSITDKELLTFSVIIPANTILAWSLALCLMFILIARRIGYQGGFVLLLKGLLGFLAGIVSIVMLAVLSTVYAGSAFYSPLFMGLFLGMCLLAVFLRNQISPLVIVASVAGAGLANIVNILGISELIHFMLEIMSGQGSSNLSFPMGASVRTLHVVTDIYFLNLAASLVLSATKPRRLDK